MMEIAVMVELSYSHYEPHSSKDARNANMKGTHSFKSFLKGKWKKKN